MPRPLDGAVGEPLERAAYLADFEEWYERSREFWKLERGQIFAEPGNDAWDTFDSGNWAESLRLIEECRPDLVSHQRQNESRGMTNRRARIVSLPPTPYLQWELHFLLLRDRLGLSTHVVLDRDVVSLEDQGPLPEINVLDAGVMYEVVYDGNGVPDHAIRYTDTALVRRCRDFIVSLYERGEPINEFFQREIAPLPPPRWVQRTLPGDYLEKAGRQRPLRT